MPPGELPDRPTEEITGADPTTSPDSNSTPWHGEFERARGIDCELTVSPPPLRKQRSRREREGRGPQRPIHGARGDDPPVGERGQAIHILRFKRLVQGCNHNKRVPSSPNARRPPRAVHNFGRRRCRHPCQIFLWPYLPLNNATVLVLDWRCNPAPHIPSSLFALNSMSPC